MGEIEQIPPIFSALKKNGQPLYKRARAGQVVEIAPRPVTIYSLSWLAWQPPDLSLDIVCSPGTYIRSLARDLGEAAGIAAHLSALTRTASGNWSLVDAVSLTQLAAETAENSAAWQKYLQPPDRAITHLPRVVLDQKTVTQVKYGQQIYIKALESASSDTEAAKLVRAYTPTGEFLAILTPAKTDDKLWQPKKVFHSG